MKEENRRMQKECLRVSLQNQFQLFGQVINDQKAKMQKVVDSLQTMQQQQNQLIVEQLQAQQQSQKIFMSILEKLNKN